MSAVELTSDQVRTIGNAALLRELGAVGYARYIMQVQPGAGDYTLERHRWLADLSPLQLQTLIESRRKAKK